MTEAAFQRQVVDLLKLFGWEVQYAWSSMHSPAGWPDLTVWKAEHGLWFAELKSEKGKLSAKQAETIESLRAACQEVYVFRPSDWDRIVGIARST